MKHAEEPGGFSETATYFRQRAERARSDGERQRFSEDAVFYERLSTITYYPPPTYKTPQTRDRASRHRDRAAECLAIAEGLSVPECRRRMLELATMYERLAYREERGSLEDEGLSVPEIAPPGHPRSPRNLHCEPIRMK